MKRTTLAIAIAAALAAAACLQKDVTSTIYLRPDGSFDWVVLEQHVRSDGSDEASRLAEEAEYVEAVSRGDLGVVNGLLALGAQDVRVRWLRGTRPYAVMVDARFDSLAGVFDRVLTRCEVPHESSLTEADGVTTWTLRVDLGPDGERLDESGAKGCHDGFDGLSDALDVTIRLEAGSFTAATGFTLAGSDTATIDEDAIEEGAKTAGTAVLSLSWRAR
jgi:hypothetical protein